MENNDQLPVAGPVFLIEVAKIESNPQQPRRAFNDEQLQELAHSIRSFGILQPVVVNKIEEVTETGTNVRYQLIAGERRWRASQLAGLERIPAMIRSVDLDKERLELAIIENIQRVDLNPIESARAYARLQDQFGLTQREIAGRVSKSRESVANAMRLLSLPENMQSAISTGKMSESQARLLMMVSDMGDQEKLFSEILSSNLSVRDVKARVKSIKGISESVGPSVGGVSVTESISVDPEVRAVERELEEKLGAKVTVERSGPNGKITIRFHSPEEMYGIISKLKSEKRPHEEIVSSHNISTQENSVSSSPEISTSEPPIASPDTMSTPEITPDSWTPEIPPPAPLPPSF